MKWRIHLEISVSNDRSQLNSIDANYGDGRGLTAATEAPHGRGLLQEHIGTDASYRSMDAV